MNNKRANISQIQKYLNRELDARAMHKLEREAQDDPFLRDALEGYGNAKNKHHENLNALRQRLQERTAPKVRRLLPWTVTAIAASLIGFAIVVGLLYKRNNTTLAPKVAKTVPANSIVPVDTTPVVIDNKAVPGIIKAGEQAIAYQKRKSAVINERAAANRAKAESAATRQIAIAQNYAFKAAPPVTPLEEMVASDMIADKKQDTVLGGGYVAINKNPSALTPLKSKAEGADITVRPGKRTDNNPAALASAGLPLNLVSGVVLNRVDGSPLPGVSVQVVGKPQGTLTDVNGKFTLPNIKKDESLEFGSVGFNSKTLNVKNNDSLKVELDQSAHTLSEVVVVKTIKRKLPRAHPQNGWENFRKYLKDNATLPNSEEGVVTLQLTVNPNGSIGGIKVIKSLNEAADKQAISLIQQGPAWIGNINGKTEDVKVKVEFHK
ncbi:carboxypeptidase-like regulatory domain-containing protein [Mucilaginibacter sp. AK015]|uniref:carboxypeptidase-like regulatory domain-containing protein n=1 Tax=Mucilaginibacter sp. AK015 TaxID=2723072 RepID=UPI001608F519|nr:TonB family protein [Mucilaginibacter sp. AK015]